MTVQEEATKLFENIQAATIFPKTISSNMIETSQVMIKELTETVVTTLMERQDRYCEVTMYPFSKETECAM